MKEINRITNKENGRGDASSSQLRIIKDDLNVKFYLKLGIKKKNASN